MSKKIVWTLPLKTVSESNKAEHWTKSSKRHRQQQFFVRQLFKGLVDSIKLPAMVIMIRIGPRSLDKEENLPMAFKWIKDEIGACLFPEKVVIVRKKKKNGGFAIITNKGFADSDPRITWKYGQEKGKIQGIRIEIEPMP
jgi:hypothetical protein